MPGLDKAARIYNEYCNAGAHPEDLFHAIQNEEPLNAYTVVSLIGLMESREYYTQTSVRSEASTLAASQKGKDWRQLARERIRKRANEGKKPLSFAAYANAWADEEFDDGKGKICRFPRNQDHLARELSNLIKSMEQDDQRSYRPD